MILKIFISRKIVILTWIFYVMSLMSDVVFLSTDLKWKPSQKRKTNM